MTVQEQPISTQDMLGAARKSVAEISPAETNARYDADEVDLILDVREPDEWEKGHIPGALLAPRGMLEWYADPGTPYAKPELTENRDGRIVVHCASGGRSLLAAEMLQKMGYRNVASMAGGYKEWVAQDLPAVTAPA